MTELKLSDLEQDSDMYISPFSDGISNISKSKKNNITDWLSVEKKVDTSILSEEQQQAFDKYLDGENIFITGPGGNGKTRLIKLIAEHARLNKKKCQVCAMTGCAAVLLECKAKTFHSWAGIGLAIDAETKIIDRIMKNRMKKKKMV